MKTLLLRVSTSAWLVYPISALASGGWFYEAPTPLSEYHERIPTKTSQELIRDLQLIPAPDAAASAADVHLGNVIAMLGEKPIARVEAIKALDALLQLNRTGDYRKRFANAAWDLHDLLGNADAKDDEIADYANWRMTIVDKDDGFFASAPARDWSMNEAEYAKVVAQWRQTNEAARKDFDAPLGKASLALRPHWLVQRGAIAFKQSDFESAAKDFTEVIEKSPKSPRAEVAKLMQARCFMEQWRTMHAATGSPREKTDQLEHDALSTFDEYLTTYPKGRFASDIPGWKAGMARLRGDWTTFVQLIAKQVDDTAHPEVVRRALQEFERGLGEMADGHDLNIDQWNADALQWADIAARPLLAMRMLHFYLDAQATNDVRRVQAIYSDTLGDHEVTTSRQASLLRVRDEGRKSLQRLAEAVQKNRSAANMPEWPLRQTVILAWASSESGLQTQAVRLLESIAQPNDDALFARTVIYQRAHRSKDAAAAAAQLLRDFPDSAFANEARFRMGVALKDSSDWAGALLAIEQVMPEEGITDEPLKTGERPASLRLNGELAQWVDTLVEFGPVQQLIPLLSNKDISKELWSRLASTLRKRLLALDDFEGALSVSKVTHEDADARWGTKSEISFDYGGPSEPPQEEWTKIVTDMAKLQRDVRSATKTEAKAKAMLALAEAWDRYRGCLCGPLITEYPRAEPDQPGCIPLLNAIFLGLPEAQAGQVIDRRDELYHAQKLWLQAADLAPSTALAAHALEMANESLHRIAEYHDTGFQRAFETNAASLSRQIYDRLKREHSSSPEAKRAVSWTFPALHEVARLPNNGHCDDHEEDIVAAISTPDREAKTRSRQDRWQEMDRAEGLWNEFKQRRDVIYDHVRLQEPSAIVQELQQWRDDVAKAKLAFAEYTAALNDADDLIAFLQIPGTSVSERLSYFEARVVHTTVPDELADAQAPAASFFAFLRMIRAPFDEAPVDPNAEPKRGNRAPDMVKRMNDFLTRFPNSPKREAAMTRLAVNTVRSSLYRCGITNLVWPNSPWAGAYVHPFIERDAVLDEGAVFKLLDAYEKEFPRGRYLAEVHLARALACLETHRFEEALRLLSGILDDASKHDLHHHASLRIAYVFMQLVDLDQRAQTIAAIRAVPQCQPYLQRFMHSDTCGARLQLMRDWLSAELGK